MKEKHGWGDPLRPEGSPTFTSMASDFETTIVNALGEACVNVFGGGTAENYERLLASSCAVHRSRMVLRRCGNNPLTEEYGRCMAAARIETEAGVESFLLEMELWPKFADFAWWLRQNRTARIMFFRAAYCTLPVIDWYAGRIRRHEC
jgi:hypothetical protein